MATPDQEIMIFDTEMKEAKDYWIKRVPRDIEPSNLPLQRERPAIYVADYDYVDFVVDGGPHRNALRLASGSPFLLYTLLLSAVKVCLRRYTGSPTVITGSPALKELGRPNALPVLDIIDERLSFKQLLLNVRQTLLSSYEKQDYPFERLIKDLATSGVENKCPLFNIAVSLSDIHGELPDLRNDITIEFTGAADRVASRIKFNKRLFDRATVERFNGHFLNVLGRVADAIETPVCRIDLLSDSERHQLIVKWNDTAKEYSRDKTAHELFQTQAERVPDNVALVFEERKMTYRELNMRANQLAHYLRAKGAGPEVLVGMCMERGIEMVVGLLGILKSGSAYVPLDPGYPPGRLSFMLEDAQIGLLLTEERLREQFSDYHGQLICLDSQFDEVARFSQEQPANTAKAENLAYVIYTSGSTGRPKGVLIEHGGLCNLAEAQIEIFDVREDSRVLQYASLSFDASVSEVFKTLPAGGTLCLARQESLLPGAGLVELVRRQSISIVTWPPTVLAVLPDEEFPSLRVVASAGEACTPQIAARWSSGRRFLNAYGPTEATVGTSIQEYTDDGRKPTLGLPLQNKKIYLLDEHLQPSPIGVPGELYIGGVGLARGYLNRPELTAEKFMPDPFTGEPGARMYKSGDLALYLPDGKKEFLGRVDHQVKVRGFRIETGEIEATLLEHTGVQQCIVIAREDAPGDKRLVAYIVASVDHAGELHELPEASSDSRGEGPGRATINTPALSLTELRAFLAEKLPGYMLPSSFVILDSLPLTASGKVDRQALPAPDNCLPAMSKEYVEPQTGLERALATIWQSVLGIERIGIHDNFFELGGDSVHAAIFMNQLQERAGQFVQVVAIFDAPTIAQFAAYLTANYPDAVTRICGSDSIEGNGDAAESGRVDASKVGYLRQLIQPLAPLDQSTSAAARKNPPAIFIFSPPRTGSTLLRVMLGGHPHLFSPPVLELLSFNTLEERKTALAGRNAYWLEGTIRTLMEIEGCTADEARMMMEECENQQLTTQEFYRVLQEKIGERRLVDKTPYYALDLEILKRAEDYFEDPFYIFLYRHPCGMIRSYEEARLDLAFRYKHPFSARELAELVWVICCQNILEFLKGIPEHRQFRIGFEDMVSEPRSILEELCRRLNLEFHEDMLKPYKDKEKRMTDGIHTLSRMLGDYKFHDHSDIDVRVADRWTEHYKEDFLGEITWQMAESLGYDRKGFGGVEPPQAESDLWTIEASSDDDEAERLLAKIDQLSEEEIDSLLGGILTGREKI